MIYFLRKASNLIQREEKCLGCVWEKSERRGRMPGVTSGACLLGGWDERHELRSFVDRQTTMKRTIRALPVLVLLVLSLISSYVIFSRAEETTCEENEPPVDPREALQRAVKNDLARRPGAFPASLRDVGCTVKVFDSRAKATDLARTLMRGAPVLLRNDRNTDDDRDIFRPSRIVRDAGEHRVTVNTQTAYGYIHRKSTTLSEYVAHLKESSRGEFDQDGKEKLILFANGPTLAAIDRERGTDLSYAYDPPTIDGGSTAVASRESFHLSIGADLAGLPFHQHDGVANEVVRGRKTWMFYHGKFEDESIGLGRDRLERVKSQTEASGATFEGDNWNAPLPGTNRFENMTPVEWLTSVYPGLDVKKLPRWHCTARPGDVMILPKHIWHLTLNSGDEDEGGLYTTIWSTKVNPLKIPKWMGNAANLFS